MKTKIINGLKCYNYNIGWKVIKESYELLKDKSEMLMTNEVYIAKRLNESFASVCMKEFEGHIPQPGINFPGEASEMLKDFIVTMRLGVRKLGLLKLTSIQARINCIQDVSMKL